MPRHVFVDSRDAVSAEGNMDFTLQLPETLVLGSGTHKARIDSLRIPLVIPTIQASNNKIQVLLGATTYVISIPTGQYDGNTLAAAIQAALTAAAPGLWSVVYSTSSISMTISCSNAFAIIGGSYALQLMSYPFSLTSNSYKFSYVPVQGIDVMYLSCINFSSLDIVGPNGSHDCLLACNVTQPFGSVQEFSMPIFSWFDLPAITTQTLSFQLRDRNYNVLTTIPNCSFVLLIDEK